MAQTTQHKAVATLTLKGVAGMTNREIEDIVAWLRMSAQALLTKERFKLSKNYKATFYQVRR